MTLRTEHLLTGLTDVPRNEDATEQSSRDEKAAATGFAARVTARGRHARLSVRRFCRARKPTVRRRPIPWRAAQHHYYDALVEEVHTAAPRFLFPRSAASGP